ncbi:hypothetical protein PROFUN_08597 [Planoprotostelium fungivorum]|uniref:Uncharacterized protein n=1 Tax=Planoprotostelium fungivorum TaxID=1890364 RepID=A0A2P6NJ64_9EUKA|nr:hypothetical protein PROFUN_08597 [Planoprotostelium fungivorum]
MWRLEEYKTEFELLTHELERFDAFVDIEWRSNRLCEPTFKQPLPPTPVALSTITLHTPFTSPITAIVESKATIESSSFAEDKPSEDTAVNIELQTVPEREIQLTPMELLRSIETLMAELSWTEDAIKSRKRSAREEIIVHIKGELTLNQPLVNSFEAVIYIMSAPHGHMYKKLVYITINKEIMGEYYE